MQAPTRILLADLVHPTNQYKTFPYAAGCIGAHVAEALGDSVEVEIFRSVASLGEEFARRPPAVLGFSNYIWNLELSYEVIRQAKRLAPDTVIVVGGPNYPNDPAGQREFFELFPLIDFYVYKEGETPFLQLVRRLQEYQFDARRLKADRPVLAAIHYFADGVLTAPPAVVRERDLDLFSSPYLSGLLDKFFGSKDLAPLIQTKRGCPFQCTFCVEGDSYYTKLASISTQRFRDELDYIAQRSTDGSPILHIADSNFGMYEHDLEICDVVAEIRDRHGWPQTIEVSTGKNRKERVLEAVKRTDGIMRFGPALQTTDKATLENIKRSNISESVLLDMAGAAKDLNQRSYTELILGLPGETVATHLQSIRTSMEAGLQRIKTYPLVLLPGTEMADAASRQRFGLETRYRIMPGCHGTHRFLDSDFPSVEPTELVVSTNSMSFGEYLYCKRFALSVEIFYNDVYLEEIHGLARALGFSMFSFVEHCHRQFEKFPEPLKDIYQSLEDGVRDSLWDTREACLEHYRHPENLERYARVEYKNSLGMLKAVALIEHIEPLLGIARSALLACAQENELHRPELSEYIDDLIEFCRLRRKQILDLSLNPEGVFRYAFDRIGEQEFRVDPSEFRLHQPRRMRFWHDDTQARDIQTLCSEMSNPILRARSFIYPATDPGVNPYLRRSSFC